MTAIRSSTVADVVARSARRAPGRVALRFADRGWTYRELDEAVSRAAAVLLGLGLAKGDRVAAYGKNSDAYVIGFLACARAGLVHVLSTTTSPATSWPTCSTSPAAGRCWSTRRSPRGWPRSARLRGWSAAAGRRGLAARTLPLRSGPRIDVPIAESDLVQLLYTSGTTSRPKAR